DALQRPGDVQRLQAVLGAVGVGRVEHRLLLAVEGDAGGIDAAVDGVGRADRGTETLGASANWPGWRGDGEVQCPREQARDEGERGGDGHASGGDSEASQEARSFSIARRMRGVTADRIVLRCAAPAALRAFLLEQSARCPSPCRGATDLATCQRPKGYNIQ